MTNGRQGRLATTASASGEGSTRDHHDAATRPRPTHPAARCDDDLGIVDIDPTGGSEDAVDWGETGISVVEFVQTLTVGGLTGRFSCIVTIVWKRQDGRWVEARWHASRLDTELPPGFGAGA